jgi:hypothetical protein
VLFAFLAASLLATQSVAPVTPAEVGRMIDRYGAQRAIAKLLNAPTDDPHAEFGALDRVFEGIASGDGRWLALVPRLEWGIGGNTAAAESLAIVVARALPKNPAAVLRLIRTEPSWRQAQVCSFPVIEPTDEEWRAYFNVAVPAVQGVREPALQAAKRACLSELLRAQRRR